RGGRGTAALSAARDMAAALQCRHGGGHAVRRRGDLVLDMARTCMTDETRGMWLGAVGIAMFSLTLPVTRMAVAELHPVLLALGRAVVAAGCGAALLWWTRSPLPDRAQIRSL